MWTKVFSEPLESGRKGGHVKDQIGNKSDRTRQKNVSDTSPRSPHEICIMDDSENEWEVRHKAIPHHGMMDTSHATATIETSNKTETIAGKQSRCPRNQPTTTLRTASKHAHCHGRTATCDTEPHTRS